MTKRNQTGPFEQLNPWIVPNANPAFNATAQFADKLYAGAVDVTTELMDFAARRVREDLSYPSRFARCKTPQDVQRVTAEFWRGAIDDYQEEWTRLIELNRRIYEGASAGLVKASPIETKIAA